MFVFFDVKIFQHCFIGPTAKQLFIPFHILCFLNHSRNVFGSFKASYRYWDLQIIMKDAQSFFFLPPLLPLILVGNS